MGQTALNEEGRYTCRGLQRALYIHLQSFFKNKHAEKEVRPNFHLRLNKTIAALTKTHPSFVSINKDQIVNALKQLDEKGLIKILGNGPSQQDLGEHLFYIDITSKPYIRSVGEDVEKDNLVFYPFTNIENGKEQEKPQEPKEVQEEPLPAAARAPLQSFVLEGVKIAALSQDRTAIISLPTGVTTSEFAEIRRLYAQVGMKIDYLKHFDNQRGVVVEVKDKAFCCFA